jgi:hypothetical protein
MALPVITDTIRVSVEGLMANGHAWANVLHFRKSGALTNAGAIVILDPILLNHYTVNSGAGQAWKQAAPASATLQRFRYTPLDGTTASTVIGHVAAGTNGTESLPANVALVTTLRTAKRGRSYRGRCYWAPFTEGANDATGSPTAAVATATQVQWTAFLTALGGTGVSLVVASYFHATAEDVTTCTTDTRWDSQRRRLR